MQLEDYFDFQSEYDIRIKGHRIGIETVLYDYIFRFMTAEEIAKKYDTLTLEEVYATILYYLHNKQQVTKYIEDWLEYCFQARKAQEENPPPFVARLRAFKEEQEQLAKVDASP